MAEDEDHIHLIDPIEAMRAKCEKIARTWPLGYCYDPHDVRASIADAIAALKGDIKQQRSGTYDAMIGVARAALKAK